MVSMSVLIQVNGKAASDIKTSLFYIIFKPIQLNFSFVLHTKPDSQC